MAFKSKSLSDLVRVCENELSMQFYGETSVLRKSVLKVLAAVLGGALYMMQLLAVRIWKDRFVSTCSDDCLDGFGAEYGMPHNAPVYAHGKVLVSLSGSSNVTIPQGTALLDESTGLVYEVSADTEIIGESIPVPVIAESYGEKSNLEEDAKLSFRDGTPEGIVDTVTVKQISGGIAVSVEIDGETQIWGESADSYRARLLYRIQNPPAGGAESDYREWAMRFSFVTDCFVFPNYPKTNSVSVALANYISKEIEIGEEDVKSVRDYITSDVRRPVTADVRVFSVKAVQVEIVAAIAPFTESVKSSVETSVKQALRKLAPGETVAAKELEITVLSSSLAETFSISGMRKGVENVSELHLELSENYAEAANPTLTFHNGEA